MAAPGRWAATAISAVCGAALGRNNRSVAASWLSPAWHESDAPADTTSGRQADQPAGPGGWTASIHGRRLLITQPRLGPGYRRRVLATTTTSWKSDSSWTRHSAGDELVGGATGSPRALAHGSPACAVGTIGSAGSSLHAHGASYPSHLLFTSTPLVALRLLAQAPELCQPHRRFPVTAGLPYGNLRLPPSRWRAEHRLRQWFLHRRHPALWSRSCLPLD